MVSVVIPCFNDHEQIEKIVKEVNKCKLVKEVVVVDDGSGQEKKNILRDLRSIKLIEHESNKGKAAAIRSGLARISGEIVVFLDADIINFRKEHIQLLTNPLLKNEYDMCLGDREHDIKIFRRFGIVIAQTGERAILTEKLLRHKEILETEGFMIETSINKIFFRKYKVTKVVMTNIRNKYKLEKMGIVGLLKDIKMNILICLKFGLSELFYQSAFCRKMPYYGNNS
jgi:glycosyltransferase involved in cell wall biosynthesis